MLNRGPKPGLTRRSAVLLPILFAACGREEPENFPALRYAYLPPIRLNVARIDIQQRFIPSGVAPDVSQLAPVSPVEALRAMAEDRLVAFGAAGQAVFSILDASLVRHRDLIEGAMAVRLEIFGPDGQPAGFAEARVSRQHTGDSDSLRATLYDMVRLMMDAMNVEFEYQVRRVLRAWLSSGTAAETPVEQTPLGAPGAPSPLGPGAPPSGSAAPPVGGFANPPDMGSPDIGSPGMAPPGASFPGAPLDLPPLPQPMR
jgi:hypothetical protein